MKKWEYYVRIKHFLTEKEDHESIQKSMNAIADILDKQACFKGFDTSKFRKIPAGDEFFSPVEYSNIALDEMYDYADTNRIWFE